MHLILIIFQEINLTLILDIILDMTLTQIKYKKAFISLFFISCAFSSINTNKIVTIYRDSIYKVYDFYLESNDILRVYGPSTDSTNIAHGFIHLNNTNHIIMPCLKLAMGSLYLQSASKSPKRILIIGLGIGILPKAMNMILDNAYIDVIEIDKTAFDLAERFFYFKTSNHLRVHLMDGYDYLMNLPVEKSYDIIMLDAFTDLLEETCAPESFLTDKFVQQVKSRLTSNGVYIINTLPLKCSKHFYELSLYQKYFGKLYVNFTNGNRLIFGQKGKISTQSQIKSRVNYYQSAFKLLNIDPAWVLDSFKHFKRYYYRYSISKYTDWFSYIFMNNICV